MVVFLLCSELMITQPEYGLPTSLEEWHKYDNETYWRPWEHLRSFFFGSGYKLYQRTRMGLVPLGTMDVDKQKPNALGVYGTQSFVPYYTSFVSVDVICSCFRCDS